MVATHDFEGAPLVVNGLVRKPPSQWFRAGHESEIAGRAGDIAEHSYDLGGCCSDIVGSFFLVADCDFEPEERACNDVGRGDDVVG